MLENTVADLENHDLGVDSSWQKDFAGEYDFCMVFPAKDGEFRPEGLRYTEIMQKLDFDMYAYRGMKHQEEIFVLVRMPLAKMKAFADTEDFSMKLDGTIAKQMMEKGNPEAGIAPIVIPHRPDITPFEPYEQLFGKYDRATNEHLYWREPGAEHPFRDQVRLKLCEMLLESEKADGTPALKISRYLKDGSLLGVFPLHDRAKIESLNIEWKRYPKEPLPLYYIKEYFGEKIGVYFGFMEHFTRMLVIPAFVGLPIQIAVWVLRDSSAWFVPIYSFFIAMWAVCMLEFWKRKEKTLAKQWGMVDFESTEVDRQEYRGEWIDSYTDGAKIRYYSQKKRTRHIQQSLFVVGAFVMLVIGVVVTVFFIRLTLVAPAAGYTIGHYFASIVNATTIQIFNLFYGGVAHRLTDRENHRTDTEYEDSMIVKLFMFQFVNSYAAYFYVAFVGKIMGDCTTGCMDVLGQNVAVILASRLFTGNLLEVGLPYYRYHTKYKKDIQEGEGLMTRPEQEHLLDQYDQSKTGMEDYSETAIGFGYASLFISALPIAGLVLLISNVVEIRMDGWKLLNLYQRPFPRGCEDIGKWQDIFLVLTIISVVTNSALTVFTMNTLNALEDWIRYWIFVLFQWVCFSLQALIMIAIPDIPEEIEIQLARMAFVVSKLIDRVADDDDADEEGIEEPLEIQEYPDEHGDDSEGDGNHDATSSVGDDAKSNDVDGSKHYKWRSL